jgi:hypothetical protein
MKRQIIIEATIKAINRLPEDKAKEIADFANSLMKRNEENLLAEGIQKLTMDSQGFDFLNAEEELYTMADLKEVYNT